MKLIYVAWDGIRLWRLSYTEMTRSMMRSLGFMKFEGGGFLIF